MADATTAARARIDRALAALERKVNELKARPATARPIEDDDLFAIPSVDGATDRGLQARIAQLEAAGQDASDALGRAIDELRAAMLRDEDPEIDDDEEDEDD
ncbi:MAG: hypothetical protein ACT6RD_02745 [Brevundimonas sp.]|uniref:hypothetical protein n=1 Tax=Brevundimonas sp. TaxID=1871086 RepID=UPI0040341677